MAAAIADQLKTQLTGAEQKAVTKSQPKTQRLTTPTCAAWRSSITNTATGLIRPGRAESTLRPWPADPNFALAWARLAVMRSFLYFNMVDRETQHCGSGEGRRPIAPWRSHPKPVNRGSAQGAYRYRILRDFEGAVASYKQAQTRLPNNAYVLQNLAFVLRRVGRWDEAEAIFKKALELDPRDVSLLSSLGGEFYNYLRRFDDARKALDAALAIAPDAQTPRANKAGVYLSEGKLDEAAAIIRTIPGDAATEDFSPKQPDSVWHSISVISMPSSRR